MLNVGQDRPSLVEINAGSDVRAVAFATNGEYFVSGGAGGVRVWRAQDGQQMASMPEAQHVRCLAVSKDGRWIAAGTYKEVIVWDAETYKIVFAHESPLAYFNGVDFSPDSTRLVTGSLNTKVYVWDVEARQRVVGPIPHKDVVVVAKFSPDGTRIATAIPSGSVHVYDSNDGHPLVDISIEVLPWFNTGLLWSKQHLFVVSDSTIKQIDASTGSEISGWRVPGGNDTSCCISLPQHSEHIAYAANRTVTVWDTSTHSQLDLIQHPENVHSIVHSPDDRFLVIAGEHGKITVKDLTVVNDSIPLSRLHPTFQEPDIQIDGATLDAWKSDQLENADALLTATISTSGDPSYHALASRALVRTRLRDWDAALGDAEKSIKIKPSVVGYVAKSMALVSKGEKYDGYRACDIAFERFHSSHVSFILLIKAVIAFIAGDHIDAISRIDDLIATVRFNSICYLVQAYMYHLLGNSHMDRRDYEGAIRYFKCAQSEMRCHASQTLSAISLMTGWKFDDLGISIQKCLCEALYAASHTKEAGESLLKLANTVDEDVHLNGPLTAWLSDFMQKCLSASENSHDKVSGEHDSAPLQPVSPTPLLRQWVKFKLTSRSWEDALLATASFTAPKFLIYRTICERLETLEQIMDAAECFHQIMREFEDPRAEQAEWIHDFKQRFAKKLEYRGDTAATAQRHDEAISEYSAALNLGLASPYDLFVKRSKTYMDKGLWKDALNDANEAIKIDPSSPWGYERKHAALHKAGDYNDAIKAFETMLSKIAHSPDPEIRRCRDEYVDPEKTRVAIRRAVQGAIRDTPRVLIHTDSGRLLDKTKRASLFETLPVYHEMISCMTTSIDDLRIEQEVTQYYHYATFSHRWEEDEPLFDKVIHIVVYDLKESSTHDKLRMFCKIVRDAGFHWAWSDTCCIDKTDHFVLQEALVAMFKWYEGSAVTIVYLSDVSSPSQRGDLVKSVWNTRAWTFQEYHASKKIRFYTKDWTLYMNLDIDNHKESPEIISEMEEATSVSAQTLRPGSEDIREKLYLASRRETTYIEDSAYSLFGVFSVSLPIVYGEGDKALGRLLAQLLVNSGDTSILAWTGKSGSFNSCLPADITVFNQLQTTHIPAISDAEVNTIATKLSTSPLNVGQAQKLYERIDDLSVPMFAGRRMKLPCIMFKLGRLSAPRGKSERVFRAQTHGLGVVEIKTKEDLSRYDSLYLVHPWIDFLLHRHPVGSGAETAPEESTDDQASSMYEAASPGSAYIMSSIKRSRTFATRLGLPFGGRSTTPPRDAMSLRPPSSVSPVDRRMRTQHFVARLRQPFGALLLTPTRQNVPEYRRVASDSKIIVQVQEDALLSILTDNTRVLDVL